MTQIFSRGSLLKYKSRLRRVQSSSTSLHMIPEVEEPRTSSSSWVLAECSLKRTFSTSHIEVSLADPLEVPSRNERSGATSPAPSTSSASSYSLPTPTSSDDECSSPINLRPISIAKNNTQMSTCDETSFIELDSDDESDQEWYTKEFSKMIWPLPPSFPKQLPSRPDSLQLEPFLAEARMTRPPNPPKRVVSHKHKHSRSTPKRALPPLPATPAQTLPSPTTIPGIAEPLKSPNVVIQPRSSSLSYRRPPPRTSMPVDCLADDFVIDEDQSHWSSDFERKQPSPAFISPPPRVSSFSAVPHSPRSMRSKPLARRHPYSGDFDDVGEIEFAVSDLEFDLNFDMSTRLSLSLSNSSSDLETDFTLGLDALWNPKEARLVPPMIAVLDADEDLQSSSAPESTASCEPLSPTPTAPTFSKSYRNSKMGTDFLSVEQDNRPTLRSKWSSSTLASVCEHQRSRSKFGAADKFKHYFGVAPPLLKSRQQQQEKRMGSAGAIHHSSSRTPASPTPPRTKKAQRQAILIPTSSSYLSLGKPSSSTSAPLWKRPGAVRSQS